MDVFDEVGGNFALKIHLPEIALDTVSAKRALAAVNHHPRLGFNHDSSHLIYQGVDYTGFVRAFPKRFFRVHLKAVWWGHGNGEVGVFGGYTSFGDARRFWNFHSLGRGDVRFEDVTVALNDVGHDEPLSVEWEDAPMDHLHGAAESAAFTRKLDLPTSNLAFDAAFQKRREL